jgi:hypothetical protein
MYTRRDRLYVHDYSLAPLVPLVPLAPLVPLVPLLPLFHLLGTLLAVTGSVHLVSRLLVN